MPQRIEPLPLENITKRHFQAFERVRKSGVINMWDAVHGCELSGLTREQYSGVMKHYEALMEKWPDGRK